MKLPDNVTSEQLLQAVRDGVCDAMWQMMTNATPMPCNDFYDTVKDGIKEAMPDSDDILKAIADGIDMAMPFQTQIMNAITDGVKEAHRRGEKR